MEQQVSQNHTKLIPSVWKCGMANKSKSGMFLRYHLGLILEVRRIVLVHHKGSMDLHERIHTYLPPFLD
tara:strand:+ start:430 stop:636 length:207 start_codon:yes stop_codon:yes gene_type:complete